MKVPTPPLRKLPAPPLWAGAAVLVALAVAPPVTGQETIDRVVEEAVFDEMAPFARVHLELTRLRDELHQELARFHEPGRRREVRDDADARVAEIHRRHSIPPPVYEAFIARVSVDAERRDAFQIVLERVREEGG